MKVCNCTHLSMPCNVAARYTVGYVVTRYRFVSMRDVVRPHALFPCLSILISSGISSMWRMRRLSQALSSNLDRRDAVACIRRAPGHRYLRYKHVLINFHIDGCGRVCPSRVKEGLSARRAISRNCCHTF